MTIANQTIMVFRSILRKLTQLPSANQTKLLFLIVFLCKTISAQSALPFTMNKTNETPLSEVKVDLESFTMGTSNETPDYKVSDEPGSSEINTSNETPYSHEKENLSSFTLDTSNKTSETRRQEDSGSFATDISNTSSYSEAKEDPGYFTSDTSSEIPNSKIKEDLESIDTNIRATHFKVKEDLGSFTTDISNRTSNSQIKEDSESVSINNETTYFNVKEDPGIVKMGIINGTHHLKVNDDSVSSTIDPSYEIRDSLVKDDFRERKDSFTTMTQSLIPKIENVGPYVENKIDTTAENENLKISNVAENDHLSEKQFTLVSMNKTTENITKTAEGIAASPDVSLKMDKRQSKQVRQTHSTEPLDGSDSKALAEGEAPYHVSIKIPIGGIVYYGICSGALVSTNKVLTSANCLVNNPIFVAQTIDDLRTLLKVVAGSVKKMDNVPDEKTKTNAQWRDVIYLAIHRSFLVDKAPRNDMALLYVDAEFVQNDFVSPIVIATSNADYTGKCQITGYGTPSGSSGKKTFNQDSNTNTNNNSNNNGKRRRKRYSDYGDNELGGDNHFQAEAGGIDPGVLIKSEVTLRTTRECKIENDYDNLKIRKGNVWSHIIERGTAKQRPNSMYHITTLLCVSREDEENVVAEDFGGPMICFNTGDPSESAGIPVTEPPAKKSLKRNINDSNLIRDKKRNFNGSSEEIFGTYGNGSKGFFGTYASDSRGVFNQYHGNGSSKGVFDTYVNDSKVVYDRYNRNGSKAEYGNDSKKVFEIYGNGSQQVFETYGSKHIFETYGGDSKKSYATLVEPDATVAPVLTSNVKRGVLVGISAGSGNNMLYYTRISKYSNWIQRNTAPCFKGDYSNCLILSILMQCILSLMFRSSI